MKQHIKKQKQNKKQWAVSSERGAMSREQWAVSNPYKKILTGFLDCVIIRYSTADITLHSTRRYCTALLYLYMYFSYSTVLYYSTLLYLYYSTVLYLPL